MIELPRRKFLTAAAAVFCAPAIIKADSLMKVRAPRLSPAEIILAAYERVGNDMLDMGRVTDAYIRAMAIPGSWLKVSVEPIDVMVIEPGKIYRAGTSKGIVRL